MEISLDKLLSGGFSQEQSTKSTTSTNSSNTKSTNETAKTLETFHNQNINKIREEKTHVQQLRKELQEKIAEYNSLEQQFSAPLQLNSSHDIFTLTNHQVLEKEIQELEDRIKLIESGEAEADYFLRVGDILFSYTDAQDRIAAGQTVSDVPGKKVKMPSNSVYSYFAAAVVANDIEDISEPQSLISESIKRSDSSQNQSKRASDIVNDIGFHRDKALETYLSALDPNNIQNDAAVMSTLEENYGDCPICESEMFFNETFLDCPECGHREYILVDSEKPSYKDPPREMSYYAYKKINHLNEWLAQFQAKETTEIPTSILDQIRAELRKERITDMSKVKASKLKEVLKKLKLSRCYDHVAHILNRLNGISAPVLSREVEEKLRFMFKEIQFSFVKHCPKKRSNFLSYSFVLYKFCELLELDEYLPCFPLLKSREKLYMQDKIWQLICQDMGWEFIRTV